MSDPIDKWVEKNPESWSKLVSTKKQKLTFNQFKKQFKKGAIQNNKKHVLKHMTNQQLKKIYEASGKATTKTSITMPDYKPFKPKTKTITRQGKTYTRTIQPRWEKNTLFTLNITAMLKPKSKDYKKNIQLITESTGRTRQAVVKKIQRLRRKQSKP